MTERHLLDRAWVGPFVRRTWPAAVAGGLLCLPLVAACAKLAGKRWAPLFDLALFEMHVRDVSTRYAPLLGLGGRLARWPEMGCHPGPFAFYLLAPVYQLLGRSYFALRVSLVLSNATAMVVALAIAYRRTKAPGVVAIGMVFGVVELGFGLLMFSEPWNPYIPPLWFITFLLAVWSVLAGDVMFLPAAAAMASLCAQTHISFAPICVGLSALACAVVFGTWVRRLRKELPRRQIGIAWTSAIAVAAVLWAPPALEQWMHRRGNMSILLDYFRHPPESPAGLRTGIALALERLDWWSFTVDAFRRLGVYREGLEGFMSSGRGGLVLVVWLLAAGAALRRGSRTLVWLHVTVAATVALDVAAMSRIIGFPYPHVAFFGWCVGGFVVFAILTTIGTLSADAAARAPRWVVAIGLLFVTVCAARLLGKLDGVLSTRSGSSLVLPLLADDTARAVRSGRAPAYKGQTGFYVVTWEDALRGGSEAIGMVLELQRRRIRAYLPANEMNRVVVGAHRMLDPKSADARIHIVNGAWVEEARRLPGAIQVAYSDSRTPAEREEYTRLVGYLAEELRAIGRGSEVRKIERDLRAVKDGRLTIVGRALVKRIDEIGMPEAVFIVPSR